MGGKASERAGGIESMATTNDPRSKEPGSSGKRPWPRRDGLFRFTVEQFYQLDELGFFEDRHVELIRGVDLRDDDQSAPRDVVRT